MTISIQLRQEQLIKNQLELEKADQEMRNKMAAEQELETIKLKRKQKESFLDELVCFVIMLALHRFNDYRCLQTSPLKRYWLSLKPMQS